MWTGPGRPPWIRRPNSVNSRLSPPSSTKRSLLAWAIPWCDRQGGCGSGACYNDSSSSAPPSAFSSPHHVSQITPGTSTPWTIASQVSRLTAARNCSRRNSKASLRLPASVSVRSHSTTRKESGARRARARATARRERSLCTGHSFPRQPADMQGSFLDMEGRPAGDEGAVEDRSDGDDNGNGNGDRNTSVSGELTPDPR
jgi:hypothetical protein